MSDRAHRGPGPATPLLRQLSEEMAVLLEWVAPAIVALFGSGPTGTSTGSGFLLDDAGHVVTNFHVVEGVRPPMDAVLHAGETRKATLVGTDPMTDLALVRVPQPPPRHLALREGPARLGEICIGVGSPFGIYPESVAIGVVSGVARTLEQAGQRPIDRAIQTDVAINPGNSGGPLLDVRGEVIGVNKSIDPRGTGIGFAIPADTVRWVVGELIAGGAVVRAALGITVVPRPVEVEGVRVVGLAVTRVGPTGETNGLAPEDVLLRIDGQAVDEASDLYRLLTKEMIGRPMAVRLLRGGVVQEVTVRPVRLEEH